MSIDVKDLTIRGLDRNTVILDGQGTLRNGFIEHSYASGQPDSGIYVGQCSDCNTVIDAVTAENIAVVATSRKSGCCDHR